MTQEKFQTEIETLQKFFKIYCDDKHSNQNKKEYKIDYKDKSYNFEISLCEECHNMLSYSINRLQECPHDIKPKCRKCPNSCYEKDRYKQMAKIMRHSGMKLGVTKAAQRLKKLFKKSENS